MVTPTTHPLTSSAETESAAVGLLLALAHQSRHTPPGGVLERQASRVVPRGGRRSPAARRVVDLEVEADQRAVVGMVRALAPTASSTPSTTGVPCAASTRLTAGTSVRVPQRDVSVS